MYRISKKQDRLDYQRAQFESLIKQGYTQETYKGLNIFTQDKDGKFFMKVFRDTAAHHIAYYSYRSLERMNEAKQQYKDGYDRSQAYKAEQKANPKSSTAANCAAAIRAELKEKFPHIKFSVTSSNFSMGNSVDIKYTDGPTEKEVEAITGKYQHGSFNSMEDMYENTNWVENLPQAKYVSVSREMSEETRALLLKDGENIFDAERWHNVRDVHNFIYRVFVNSSIPEGATVTGIIPTGETCGLSTPETFYTIGFSLPDQQQEPNFEKVEVKPGIVQIIDYSAKAIAVIGDTKPIKDQLKALGGKFNFRLSCGAGWIFPKTKLSELQKALTPQPVSELKEEVQKTLDFLVETDKKIYGEVSEGTKAGCKMQGVEVYETLEDINEAAEGGKVISLCNLLELVTAKPSANV